MEGRLEQERERENERAKRGEVVVLRSVRMSAFPLSGEGYHRLSMSVTPLVYALLGGRGKRALSRWRSCVCVGGVFEVDSVRAIKKAE